MLIEFLNDTTFCALNGRFGEEANEFASSTFNGLGVVDYCMTHEEDLYTVKSLKIETGEEICNRTGLNTEVGDL